MQIKIRLFSRVWWCTPGFPAIWEADTGELQFEAIWGKVSPRPYRKNKLKTKGLEKWLK
jgi:hypothetical protein